MVFSLRRKIVAPFMALVVFVGVVGTAAVMTQLARTTTTQFDGTLLRAGSLAGDHLALLEAGRVGQLRAAANTLGVPAAVQSGNAAALGVLLSPLVINAGPSPLTFVVMDRTGRAVVEIRGGAAGAAPAVRTRPASDFGNQPGVTAALAGSSDQLGDKYVFEGTGSSGPTLNWVAPIRSGDTPVGALVIIEPIAAIAAGIRGSGHSDVIFYGPDGRVLDATLAGVASLDRADAAMASEEHPLRVSQVVGGHRYGVLVAPWVMRGRALGFIGAAVKADGLYAALGQFALILALIFTLLALLVIVVGLELARRITRPIDRLVTAMRAVEAGDLTRRAPPAGRDEIGLLTTSFNAMAAGLERKTSEVEEAYFSSLEALARAIDARDPYTFEHSSRVAAISLEIAEGLRLAPDGRRALQRSGLLHDVGKIGVQDRILLKNGPLTDEEWAVIRRHPSIGFDMLKDVAFLRESMDGIRHHHERWDGAGYPDGLKGEAIPLQARIVGVADAFDAMTSDRAYRKGFSVEFSVRAVRNGAGSQFDPAAVAAFEARLDAILLLLKDMGRSPMPHAAEIRWKEEAA